MTPVQLSSACLDSAGSARWFVGLEDHFCIDGLNVMGVLFKKDRLLKKKSKSES